MRLHGASTSGQADEHRVQVLLNGTLLGDSWWQGIAPHEAIFPIPAGVLQEGENAVEVVALLDSGIPFSLVFLDGFEVTAPRHYRTATGVLPFSAAGNAAALLEGMEGTVDIFEVTDPRRPRRLRGVGEPRLALRAGADYLAVERNRIPLPGTIRLVFGGDVLAEGARSEYLVLAPESLLEAAEELALHHRQRGLGARVVAIQQIFDQLSDGVPDPRAIREFLRHAWLHWDHPPRWVALAGGGTYDYRDLLGLGGNLVPPLLVPTPEGLYASDNALADLVGDDGVPEMAIGRIPVASAAGLRSYLEKIRAYASAFPPAGGGPPGADWADNALLLADAFDQGMDFGAASAGLSQRLPAHYRTTFVDLGREALPNARGQVMAAWNRGIGVLHYTGHGGLDRLAASGLVTAQDAPGLRPSGRGRLPLLTAMTCLANRFEVPGFPGLGPSLVAQPEGGAVSAWAPTGFSLNDGATQLADHFYRSLFSLERPTVGEAVQQALRRLDTLEDPRTLRWIYNLLGDPALRPHRVDRPEAGGPGDGFE